MTSFTTSSSLFQNIESNQSSELTLLPLGFIGNRVFFDENGNGLHEANESGFAGAQVTLQSAGADGIFNTDDDILRTQNTNSQGFYGFGDLAGGQYKISIHNLPEGFQLTHAKVGNNNTIDSDIDPLTGETEIINLADNQVRVDIDAGVVQQTGPLVDPKTGFIGNRVFLDKNGNGLFDENEEGFGGAQVTLRGAGADGLFETADDVIRTQTTGQQGFYGFDNLAAGQYTISLDNLPEGFQLTQANVGNNDAFDSDVDPNSGLTDVITLSAGQFRADIDAGVVTTPEKIDPKTGFIGNRVFLDANANGLLDTDEGGFAGARVTLRGAGADGLFNTNDDLVRSQTTGAEGFYGFGDLAAGQYQIAIDNLPEEVQLTQANVGGNDAIDSDFNPSSGISEQITLEVGEFRADIDAGVVQQAGPAVDPKTGFIGNRVFFDANGNGLYDGNEEGFAGARVTLRGAGTDNLFDTEDDIVQTQTTAQKGFYGFSDLAAGQYKISIDSLPEGFQLTYANVGNNDALDSDVDPNSGMTEPITLSAGQFRADIDAGVVSTPGKVDPKTGFIGNRVFFDENGNGLHDVNEGGFAGAQVTLRGAGADAQFNTADDLIRTQTTGAEGFYGFSNLAAGQYRVAIEGLPAGYELTQANVGVNDAIDSDFDPSTGTTDDIFLLAGQFRANFDGGVMLTQPLIDSRYDRAVEVEIQGNSLGGQAILSSTADSDLAGIDGSFWVTDPGLNPLG